MGIAALIPQITEALLPWPPRKLGVAVSGGGDSMALLHLLHQIAADHDMTLHAVTVNHGLRPEAGAEAEMVARFCATLGIPHDTLLWDDWDGKGNLQSQARKARFDRIGAWAKARGIAHVALGHTAEDQAETVLMRLGRSAGVDGLSAMPVSRLQGGVTWLRPLLDAHRAVLRDYLRDQGIGWVDDPFNEDESFARVRMRRALETLTPLGIDVAGLAQVAKQMGAARRALTWQTFLAARKLARVDAGAIVLDERKLRIQPDEIQRRLLVHAVTWISRAEYPPRRSAMTQALTALQEGRGATVDGCQLRPVRGEIWVFRELNAVRGAAGPQDALWDARWRLRPAQETATGQSAPIPPETGQTAQAPALTIRALGPEGLAQCPDWRASGLPHQVVLSTPAVWRGDTVVAAPLAGRGQNWHADLEGGSETFFAGLLSH